MYVMKVWKKTEWRKYCVKRNLKPWSVSLERRRKKRETEHVILYVLKSFEKTYEKEVCSLSLMILRKTSPHRFNSLRVHFSLKITRVEKV